MRTNASSNSFYPIYSFGVSDFAISYRFGYLSVHLLSYLSIYLFFLFVYFFLLLFTTVINLYLAFYFPSLFSLLAESSLI